jgi:hypothetical protein
MNLPFILSIVLWAAAAAAWADDPTPLPTATASPAAGAPTAVPTPTPGSDLLRSVSTNPETSNQGQPIQFQATLARPATLHLSIYTLAGELVYQADQAGQTGANAVTWNLKDQAQQPVRGDVYIYLIQANDGVAPAALTGRVLVIP